MHMLSSTRNFFRRIAVASVFVFVFASCASVYAKTAHEKEWLDFEPQPLPTFTLGVPVIINPLLYDIRNNNRLSERTPDCRLVTLDDCCDGVWTLQWWEYQQIMDAQRDHYVYLYRRDHDHQDPFQDPEIKRKEDFKLPMEAAATLALPQETEFQAGDREPSFTFRCVLTLAPNSLLGFVASQNFPVTSPKDARWTKPYRIFCLKDKEQPYIREVSSRRYVDPVTHEVAGTGIKMVNPKTRTGFCGPRDLKQGHHSPHPPHGDAQVIDHRSYPYDPTALQTHSSTGINSESVQWNSAVLPHINIPSGHTRCFDIPPSFLMAGTSFSAVATPSYTIPASANQYVEGPIARGFDSAGDTDLDKWDLDQLSEPVYDDPEFLFFMDPSLPNQEPFSSFGQQRTQHSSLRASLHPPSKRRRTDIHEGIAANEEQRLQVKDIDWDAIRSRNDPSSLARAGSKVSACVNVPMEPPLGFELRFEPWEMDQIIEAGPDGGVINW